MLQEMLNINLGFAQLELEKINPLFSKAKIYVMYHGENRNNSFISKESVEKSLHTIKNIPIVGEFKETSDGGNFGDHGGKIEIDDNGIKYIHTTKPIGVIPSEAKVYWKTITDSKEREREYLVVDGVYLWNRYEEEISTLKEDNFGQSMEIRITEGDWDEETNLFHIKEFIFSALCILGIDKNGEGHVEPAFEDAKIITYSLDDNCFKDEFTAMLKELESFTNTSKETKKEGFENMLDKILEKYSITKEYLIENNIDFTDLSEEELEKEIELLLNNVSNDNEVNKNDSLEGNVNNEHIIKELRESLELANNTIKNLTKDVENRDKEIATLSETVESQTGLVNSLNDKVEELEAFKSNVEKNEHMKAVSDMISEFTNLSEKDIEDIDIHNLTLEEIEKEIYTILGKKYAVNKKYSVKGNKNIKLPVIEEINQNDLPYGGLFDKYKE